jgi:hypothetical protein
MNSRFMLVLIGAAVTLLGLVGHTAAAPAHCAAGKGSVVVTVSFVETNGGYCPPGRSCLGARYLQSDYNVHKFLPEVPVAVRHKATGTILATGYAAPSIILPFAWLIEIDDAAFPFCVWGEDFQIVSLMDEKDGRFAVYNTAANAMFANVTEHTSLQKDALINSQITSANGRAASNILRAAMRAWVLLNTSHHLRPHFHQVRILPSTSNGSSANAPAKTVIIGQNHWYTGSAMHEFGHLAEAFAAASSGTPILPGAVDYCYPALGCNQKVHDFTSPEHKHTAYTEGLAHFVWAASLYGQNANAPHICTSVSACPFGQWNLESTPTCDAGSDRQSLNVARYLWDLYDSNNDQAYNDALSYSFNVMFVETIRAFPAGFDNRQINEPLGVFNGVTYLDDPDGRSSDDHRYHFDRITGTRSALQGELNCQWSPRLRPVQPGPGVIKW